VRFAAVSAGVRVMEQMPVPLMHKLTAISAGEHVLSQATRQLPQGLMPFGRCMALLHGAPK